MNILENNILDIAKNNYKFLTNMQNVIGVGLGYKNINDFNTLEPCLHVLVENKINSNFLSKNNIVPKSYMGIKTDVIQVGKLDLLKGEAITFKLRPLEGGGGISVADHKSAGTIGYFVTKGMLFSKKYYILSNNHVLAGLNSIPIGTPIIQPIDVFGGKIENDMVALLKDFVPVKFINGSNEPENYVDCAIAQVTSKSIICNRILGDCIVKGINKPKLGENVRKTGFVTGTTKGSIITTGVTKYVTVSPTKKVLFKNQILAKLKSNGGDSGSAIVNENNEIVGLVMSGNLDNVTTTFNDINMVLDSLNAKIYLD